MNFSLFGLVKNDFGFGIWDFKITRSKFKNCKQILLMSLGIRVTDFGLVCPFLVYLRTLLCGRLNCFS